eukprot:TRINITY_DN17739_c0_g2_i1.p1 TRINITY_DN17739_c0_g2~~TRINITY_DN17739_c0_g2_i1.p1  ORF type:complete len:234 (+),score=34.51 TRINITY_DN17739_c0_g2_i1:68-769(+)
MSVPESLSTRYVIACLGQSLLPDGSPPPCLPLRVSCAVGVYKELSAEATVSIYVSGADTAGDGAFKTEGEVMLEMLLAFGVSAQDIDVDVKAQDTLDNALNSLMPIKKRGASHVTLVTSDFHLPRALFIFKSVFAVHAPSLVLRGLPAESGLSVGKVRESSSRPFEINDWNWSERVDHEMEIMKGSYVGYLERELSVKPHQGDIDEALRDLEEMATASKPGVGAQGIQACEQP